MSPPGGGRGPVLPEPDRQRACRRLRCDADMVTRFSSGLCPAHTALPPKPDSSLSRRAAATRHAPPTCNPKTRQESGRQPLRRWRRAHAAGRAFPNTGAAVRGDPRPGPGAEESKVHAPRRSPGNRPVRTPCGRWEVAFSHAVKLSQAPARAPLTRRQDNARSHLTVPQLFPTTIPKHRPHRPVDGHFQVLPVPRLPWVHRVCPCSGDANQA